MKLLATRFGDVPSWANERIGALGAEGLEELGVRFAQGQSLEELFREA